MLYSAPRKKSPSSKVPLSQAVVHQLEENPGCQAERHGNSVPQDITKQKKLRTEVDWTLGFSEVELLMMRPFYSHIKPHSSESESFPKEQELDKCLTGEVLSPQPPQETLLSPSIVSPHSTGDRDSLIQQ